MYQRPERPRFKPCGAAQIFIDKYQQYDSVVSKLRENEADFKMLGERYSTSPDEARKAHALVIRQMYAAPVAVPGVRPCRHGALSNVRMLSSPSRDSAGFRASRQPRK